MGVRTGRARRAPRSALLFFHQEQGAACRRARQIFAGTAWRWRRGCGGDRVVGGVVVVDAFARLVFARAQKEGLVRRISPDHHAASVARPRDSEAWWAATKGGQGSGARVVWGDWTGE